MKGLKTLYRVGFVMMVLCSCAAPRAINISGKTTPKGNLAGGVSYTANLPTATIAYVTDIAKENIKAFANRDTITLDENFNKVNRAAVTYAVDPFGSGYDFYLKYGFAKRFDAGYKRAGNANVLAAQYQFAGPTGNVDDIQPRKFYASIGLQYSWQRYKLPSFLSDLQSRLGYDFKRKDYLVPLVFSFSLGNEEEYGSVAFGVAYSYTQITYSTLPDKILNQNNMPVFAKQLRQNFSSVGGFFNLKAGYTYVYIIPAISFFYQDYGAYQLLDGSQFRFKGFTFVPSVSLQFRLGKTKKAVTK